MLMTNLVLLNVCIDGIQVEDTNWTQETHHRKVLKQILEVEEYEIIVD